MTDTLDLQEASDFLKLNSETMRRLAASGKVPGAKIGRPWVFFRSDLAEYLRNEIREQTAARRNDGSIGSWPQPGSTPDSGSNSGTGLDSGSQLSQGNQPIGTTPPRRGGRRSSRRPRPDLDTLREGMQKSGTS